MSFSYDNIPDAAYEDVVHEVFGAQALTENGTCFNFVCPHCGDMNFPNKRKAYVYKNSWQYICYKCSDGQHLMSYLKENYPDQYDRLLFYGFDEGDRKPKSEKKTNEVVRNAELPFEPNELIPITANHPLAKSGLELCKKRLIRPAVYEKWFVCLEGSQFYKRSADGQVLTNSSGYPLGNEYKNRIIIPFYRFGGGWGQFDARAIDPNVQLRYRNFSGVKRTAYNIDFLDVSRPFYILEGTIDSTFIRNSIAIGGIQHLNEILAENPQIEKNKANCTIIWDNDAPGQKAMIETVKRGYKWFDWSHLTEKDINGAVMANQMPLDAKGFVDQEFIRSRSMDPKGADILFAMKFGDVEKKEWLAKKEAKRVARERLERAKEIGILF